MQRDMTCRHVLLGLALIALVYGTIMVFVAFDRASHSASDTLRPFLLTMAPVWIVAIAGARGAPRQPVIAAPVAQVLAASVVRLRGSIV
jgi:hypothetical protein